MPQKITSVMPPSSRKRTHCQELLMSIKGSQPLRSSRKSRPVNMTMMPKYRDARKARQKIRLNRKSRRPWKRPPPCISPMVPCSARTAALAEVSSTVRPAKNMAVLWLMET